MSKQLLIALVAVGCLASFVFVAADNDGYNPGMEEMQILQQEHGDGIYGGQFATLAPKVSDRHKTIKAADNQGDKYHGDGELEYLDLVHQDGLDYEVPPYVPAPKVSKGHKAINKLVGMIKGRHH